jgi:predicted dehydrogenase
MKYALIGFGTISPVHVRAITERCKHEIVAICDTQLDKCKQIGLPGVRFYQDYHALFAQEKIDVAVILTPHDSHPEISIAALQAGCHVFCEKPVAVNKLHAAPLARALGETDRIFGVNFMKRFRPDVQAVKTLLNEKRLGKLRAVNFVINKNLLRSSFYFRQGGGWRGTWSKEGGGALINQASHDVDRLVYLFGPPTEVQAQAGTSNLHRDCVFSEDYVEALLSYPDGLRLHFSTALHLHPGVDRLEIWGDRGYLKMENNILTTALLEDPLDVWDERQQDLKMENGIVNFGAPQPVISEQKVTPLSFDDLHLAGHINFINAAAGREAVMTSFDQAMQSVELANAMVLAGYQKKFVTLPLDGQAYSAFLQEMMKREQGA